VVAAGWCFFYDFRSGFSFVGIIDAVLGDQQSCEVGVGVAGFLLRIWLDDFDGRHLAEVEEVG